LDAEAFAVFVVAAFRPTFFDLEPAECECTVDFLDADDADFFDVLAFFLAIETSLQ